MNSLKIAAYIRLSKEDDKNKESESINNQRQLINQYLTHHNLTITEEYIDDGFSGTTFNRPAFNKLITDIENSKINMVITKDLSRLGRDYIKSGYYIEEYFPKKKVRYISILDNVDTSTNNVSNDIAPFKALFNDMVSKDTSRKIKSILESKKKEGMYLASKQPYGYKKNPNNKHKLVVEKNTAKIVKKIYNFFLNGNSINEIVNFLNDHKILTPSKKNVWSYSSVYNILKNKIYIGTTTQNVWTNISYKNKKKVKRNKNEWIIKTNAHKPIIDKKSFNQVQKKLKAKQSSPINKRPKLLLEGLVYCQECKHLLGANYNKKTQKWYLVCNNYKKNSRSCTSHYLDYNKLEKEIINYVKKYVKNCISSEKNRKKVIKLRNKMNILYQDRLNNIIDLQQYQLLKREINAQIKSLHQEEKLKISRRILMMLINCITVDKNKNIMIEYTFEKPKDLNF